jgi:arsenate reductase
MAEIGIDISKNRSKNIEEFRGSNFNYVVTVCDSARESCPFFPGEKIIHKAFKDPSQFKGSEEEILKGVRRIREEIREWIKGTFG